MTDCHTASLPTQKCLLAISLTKIHIKICCVAWPGSLWALGCIPQGIGVSLVWYSLLTFHLGWEGSKGEHLDALVSAD